MTHNNKQTWKLYTVINNINSQHTTLSTVQYGPNSHNVCILSIAINRQENVCSTVDHVGVINMAEKC